MYATDRGTSISSIFASRHARGYRLLLACLASTVLLAGLLPGVARAEGPNAIQYLNGCENGVLGRNDDGSTGRIDLPFAINFFGTTFDALWINNNGNVTFDGPMSTYTPFSLQDTGREIIAPFFADVDTRNSASDVVRYGFTTYGGRQALCVNWAGVGVGYYPSSANRLNSFQLLLVDRSDLGIGDFDIVMNYDKIQWESGSASGGSGGLGGHSARIGFSNGTGAPGTSFELPGSAVNGAFLDSNSSTGLIYGSRNSLQLGRYVYPVRNGAAPTGGQIYGFVTAGGNPVAGAAVQACPAVTGSCLAAFTNSTGRYSFAGLPIGSYEVRVNPPADSSLLQAIAAGLEVQTVGSSVRHDFALVGPDAPPSDTTITSRGTTGDGVPVVYWNEALTLRTEGCIGGAAYYEIAQAGVVLRGGLPPATPAGEMTETPALSGRYEASVSPLHPDHGTAEVRIQIDCPNPVDNEVFDFNIYIDPSGFVRDTHGAGIAQATVTLYRSDSSAGPFAQVPNGSAIMSPSNRTNPDNTDATGHFGWDVIAGYYFVRATALDSNGNPCVDPDDASRQYVDSRVMEIPPPVTDLNLVLDCGEPANRPPVIAVEDVTLEGNASGGYSGSVPGVTATDPDGDQVTLSNDAPSLLPLGTTTVVWTATDPDGASTNAAQQVSVVDTTAPQVTCPDDIDGTVGQQVTLGAADATDVVDGSVVLSNDAPGQFGPGSTTVTWTATDDSDNSSSCVQVVTLTYVFGGFFGPVSSSGSNVKTAGQTIVFKWTLRDAAGELVRDLAVVTGHAFSPDGDGAHYVLTYEADGDYYQLRVKTPRGWAGSTKTFDLELNDGTTHTAEFRFR